MKDELQETRYFIQDMAQDVHRFIADNISSNWLVQVMVKFLILLAFVLLVDLLVKLILFPFFNRYKNETRYPRFKAIHSSRVTYSIANLLALMVGNIMLAALFSGYYRDTFDFFKRIYNLIAVLAVARFGLRIMKAFELYFLYRKNYYKIVALRAISETIRTIGIFILVVVIISIIFGIRGSTIIGSLGAITAVLVLVFRDTILGFMTSLHVATSKNLKVGDWIAIPKYNLEGTIDEINLLTTKILNFDKTISTIPTYDLLSTEIRNNQVMAEGNMRRIKKSIVFNIKSFRFIDEELFEKLQHVNLIKDYLENKNVEIQQSRSGLPNADLLINGRQLTNIGVFRKYALAYLRNDKDIDQDEVVLVRQLEITPQGMPLEIYCFANRTAMEDFEEIQADIFDHLLAASRDFDLEVMQVSRI